MKQPSQDRASPGEIDLLISYMPIIMRAPDLTEWARGFCISIVGRTKRGAFTPTTKQIGVMRRLVSEFQAAMRDDDALVERGP